MMGQYEPYRHGQLINMGQGDIDKDMCMIKPFKTFIYLFEPPFFLCPLTHHPWIMEDGNVNRAMTSNENQEDNLRPCWTMNQSFLIFHIYFNSSLMTK